MYTPPVTPWESVTPEVSDLTERPLEQGFKDSDEGEAVQHKEGATSIVDAMQGASDEVLERLTEYEPKKSCCSGRPEGAAEGGTDNWGEVVTR